MVRRQWLASGIDVRLVSVEQTMHNGISPFVVKRPTTSAGVARLGRSEALRLTAAARRDVTSVARQLRGGERYGIARRAWVPCDHAARQHASTMRTVLAGALAAFLLFCAERHGAVAVNDQLSRTAFHRLSTTLYPRGGERRLRLDTCEFRFEVPVPGIGFVPDELERFRNGRPTTARPGAWSVKIA